jgi:hypothetical protein
MVTYGSVYKNITIYNIMTAYHIFTTIFCNDYMQHVTLRPYTISSQFTLIFEQSNNSEIKYSYIQRPNYFERGSLTKLV